MLINFPDINDTSQWLICEGCSQCQKRLPQFTIFKLQISYRTLFCGIQMLLFFVCFLSLIILFNVKAEYDSGSLYFKVLTSPPHTALYPSDFTPYKPCLFIIGNYIYMSYYYYYLCSACLISYLVCCQICDRNIPAITVLCTHGPIKREWTTLNLPLDEMNEWIKQAHLIQPCNDINYHCVSEFTVKMQV